MKSPAVRDILSLDSAIAEDNARIAEITTTKAYNQRKRDLLAADLTDAEKAELDPAPASAPADTPA